MRERLTAAFVALALLTLLGAGLVRSQMVRQHLLDRQTADLSAQLVAVSTGLAQTGGSVTSTTLAPYAGPQMRLTFERAGSAPVVATGSAYGDPGDLVEAHASLDGGQLVLDTARDTSLDIGSGSTVGTIGALFLLLLVAAGVAGYFFARAISAPFRQLAISAAALGRGRFDLEVPRTRVPEARAIGMALQQSAEQLRDRLAREREFGLHTSHVLRTPLTTLRLRLDALVADPSLSEEARASALDCLAAVDKLGEAAGELVDVTRRGVLVAPAAEPLDTVVRQVETRWRERLRTVDHRRVQVIVEGDTALLFTPGLIEQVLDAVLDELVVPDRDDVLLVFEGAASRLRVDIACLDLGLGPDLEAAGAPRAPSAPISAGLRATATALGGTLEVDPDRSRLRLHLPRR